MIQQDAQPTAGPSNQQQQHPPSTPPSEFDFGLFASPANLPPPSSVYPTFNKALSLARRLEVCPTIKTLKRLETPFLENPRPHKKRNVSSDEEVSLGWTDDEVDAFMGESATASGSKTPGSAFNIDLFGTEERYETNLALKAKANPSTAFNNRRVNTPAALFINVINKFVCLTLQDDKSETEAEWMLDSGASQHFTFDINNYVDYETMAEVLVRTANSFTKIIGKGTVIITVDGKTVRINPVYHIPDLSYRLLSLGQFLRSGLFSRGSAREISLHEEEKEFLTFYPRSEEDSIYVIRSLVGARVSAQIKTVFSVDFEVLHRRLTHPSNDVLRKAGRHLKDFPEVQIPKEHICPGCAQGKMTNKSFPPSNVRATEAFEMIHSDLKSFPIESYRKYRYSIVFYDDFTSHAWTVNLRSKDAALYATKHFLAMVETKYKKKYGNGCLMGEESLLQKHLSQCSKTRG